LLSSHIDPLEQRGRGARTIEGSRGITRSSAADHALLGGAFASGLEGLDFEQDGISPDWIAHRYRRKRVAIDVLAPEGLGERTDLTTTPPCRTLQVVHAFACCSEKLRRVVV